MGSGQFDSGFAVTAGYPHHVAAQPHAVIVILSRNLFGGADHAVGSLGLAADAHHDIAAGILPSVLLHHPGDDVAFPRGELAVDPLVLGVAESLQHHLAGGGRRDTSESLRGVVPFADELAVGVGFAR